RLAFAPSTDDSSRGDAATEIICRASPERRKALRFSVYGLLPFCKRIVFLMNLGTTASVYPASQWDVSCIPSHDECPLTRS
ncbi:MAG: hypothetical protein M3Q00_05440, partial [Pseudomonadota bacterium]|nr:hypothetical protein [Pseudomonadota bacterium]